MCPTRELADQVTTEIRRLARATAVVAEDSLPTPAVGWAFLPPFPPLGAMSASWADLLCVLPPFEVTTLGAHL
jgi:hypothetical protein